MTKLFAASCATWLCSSLATQVVNVQVTAFTDLRVSAGPASQSLPAGTDVSNGFDLQASSLASARSTLTVQRAPERITLSLRESANGWSDPRSGTSEGARIGMFPAHTLQVHLTAPQSLPATLRVTSKTCPFDGTAMGTFVLGGTQIASTPDCAEHTTSLPLTLKPAGVTLTLATYASDIVGWPFFAPAAMDWTLELLPDPNFPCTPTTYGAGCGGAALSATTDFAVPGTHVLRLEDPGPVAVALIAFGDQRRSIAFPPNCTVLDNLLFALPAPVHQHVATLRFRPPAIAGLVFQTQGFVGLTSGLLHMSNGIEFACP